MEIGDIIYCYSSRNPQYGILTFTIDNLLYQHEKDEEDELIAIESYYNIDYFNKGEYLNRYYLCEYGEGEYDDLYYHSSSTLNSLFIFSKNKDIIKKEFYKSLERKIKELENNLDKAREQYNID